MAYPEYILKLLSLTPHQKGGKGGTKDLLQEDRRKLTNETEKKKRGNLSQSASVAPAGISSLF